MNAANENTVAGIDCGSTLVKYAWLGPDGHMKFRVSSRAGGLEENDIICTEMMDDGVRMSRIVGLGAVPHAVTRRGLSVSPSPSLPQAARMDDELRLQAIGATELILGPGGTLPKFLLVSIGTGTSYTFVDGNKTEVAVVGNPLGGGFIYGLMKAMGLEARAWSVDTANGTPPDILFKHLMPETAAMPQGSMVVSHFGRVQEEGQMLSAEDVASGIMHVVSVAVTRDIMNIIGSGHAVPAVVVIGSPVAKFPVLQMQLRAYLPMVAPRVYFPSDGEYSAALGAYCEALAAR